MVRRRPVKKESNELVIEVFVEPQEGEEAPAVVEIHEQPEDEHEIVVEHSNLEQPTPEAPVAAAVMVAPTLNGSLEQNHQSMAVSPLKTSIVTGNREILVQKIYVVGDSVWNS